MTDTAIPTPAAEVLSFWNEAGPEKWFEKNAHFDSSFHPSGS